MSGPELFDREKVHFNLARMKKAGDKFEVVIDPDNAASFRSGALKDLKDVLKSEHVFADAKKGLLASEESMKRAFDTADPLKVANILIKEGELQLTSEYRDSLREAKIKQLVQLIHRNAIDPRTNLPHPIQRIENAFAEAKVKVDEHKKAEEQLDDVITALRPIMPIRFETLKLQVVVPSKHASRAMALLKGIGRVAKNSWHSDGTLFAVVEIPAGLQQELTDQLNRLTHGDVDIKRTEEN